MKLGPEFALYGEAFLRLFYPSACASCARLLELEERGLCVGCLKDLQKFRLQPSEERIRVTLSSGDEGWALFRYEGLAKEILHRVKFEGRRDLLRVFVPEIEQFVRRRTQLETYDCIVPIPLDSRRRLERKFNQSGLLARRIHGFLKNPRLLQGALAKSHSALPQSLLGREARRINVDHAFRVRKHRAIEGRSVLLVDDIFTTGATVDEASKMFKAAGASRVGHVTLARTMAH